MSVRESSVTGDEALLLRTVNAARFAREGWAEVYSPPASDCKCQVCSVLTSAWAPRSESATLDPQNGGLEVIPAQGVIFVRALCSPTCALFSMWHGVWSPDGPRESCQN